MRRISAHYYLRPNGSWGKYPLITLGDDGTIVSIIEMGDTFVEHPSLEFFSGALIPGLIQDLRCFEGADSELICLINKCYSLGVLHVILPANSFINHSKVKIVQRGFQVEEGVSKVLEPAWNIIKSKFSLGADSLADIITLHTRDLAQQTNTYPQWGVIQEGANPGFVLIKNMDYKLFSLRAETNLRIIV